MAGSSKSSEDNSMKQTFSSAWKRSTQPRKQRKYSYNAPYHTVTKFMSATINKELRKKHGIRSLSLRVGDKVKVMRGTYKGKTGNVEKMDTKKRKIHITGIEQTRKDGNKNFYPFEPSNIMITELNLKDKKRMKKTEEKENGKETSQKA